MGPRGFRYGEAEPRGTGGHLQEWVGAQRVCGVTGRLTMIQWCDITEVEIDGRTQKVRPVIQDVLRSGNGVATTR